MTIRVGIIKVLQGTAVAVSPQGTKRTLHEGDVIFGSDIIYNESGGKLVIKFDGGSETSVPDRGQIFINAEMATEPPGKVAKHEPDDTLAAAIQKEILAGKDPTKVAEAPAAGLLESHGHGGAAEVERLNQQVTPEAGYETTGIVQAAPVLPLSASIPAFIPQPGVSLSVLDQPTVEGQPVTYLVTLDHPSDSDVTVTIQVATLEGDTATDGSDYSGGSYTVTIPAGQTSATFTVATLQDALVEGQETFSATISSASNGYGPLVIDTTPAVATLEDLVVNVTITPLTGNLVNEGTPIGFVVALDKPAASDTIITLQPASRPNDGATAGADYPAAPVTVTIPAGQTSAVVSIDTLKDSLFEGPENFSVSATAASNGQGAMAVNSTVAVATIVDSPTVVVILVNTDRVYEGSPLNFAVKMSQPATTDTVVTLSVESLPGDTATAGSDYKGGTVTVTIPAGETTVNFSVDTFKDGLVEGPETFSVKVVTATNPNGPLAIDPAPAQATILDTPSNPTVSLSAVDYSQAKEGDAISFRVTLSEPIATDTVVTVNASSLPGDSATAVSDYVGGDYTVTIPAGSTSATFTVQTVADTLFEAPETFSAMITGVSNSVTTVAIDGTPIQATILDNSAAAPQVTLANVSGTQTEEGGNLSFEVTLSMPSSSDTKVTINVYSAPGDTASAGSDYSGGLYTVTIPAGQTSAVITVPTLDDNLFEGSENLHAVISSVASVNGPINANTTPVEAVITDAGDTPTVAVSQVNGSSAYEGQPVTFAVTMSKPSSVATVVTVNVDSLLGDTATAGSDYSGGKINVTIPAGQTSATFTVATINDGVLEPDETFSVQIESASNANGQVLIDMTPVTGTVVDSSRIPSIILTSTPTEEGQPLLVTATLPAVAATDTVVTVNVGKGPGDTADPGSDYTAGVYTITIPAGQLSGSVAVPTLNDTIFEGSETFSATITSAVNGSGPVAFIATPITNTITDSGDAPVVTLTGPNLAQVNEGEPAIFTVSLSNPASADTVVKVNVFSGAADTATASSDYAAGLYTVVIPAGQYSANFAVATVSDNLFEGAESFSAAILSASNPNGALTLDGSVVTTSILDLATVALEANPAPTAEGEPVSFVVTLSQPATAATIVTVNVTSLPGDTATAGSDYSGGSYTVTIPAGQSSAVFTVATFDDAVFEGNETFHAIITGATNPNGPVAINATPVAAVISDSADTPTVSLNVAPGQALEGSPVVFEVTLSKPLTTATTVVVNVASLAGDTATAGSDYTGGNYTVTIAAGQTSATFGVPTLLDNLLEGNETFSATVLSASNANGSVTINSTPVQGVILDNSNGVTPTLTVTTTPAEEGQPVMVTVTLNTPSSSATTVTLTLGAPGDSATPGSDYNATPVTVVIPAGSTQAVVPIATVNDTTFEGNETFTIKVDSVTNSAGTISYSANPVTATITDNSDKPSVSLSAGSAPEGSPVTFTVTLSNVAAVATTVVVNIASLAGDTATAGSDYTGGPVTVTIPAGQLSSSFNVVTLNDNIFEGNETFSGVISSATAGGTTLNYSTTPAQATIIEGGGNGNLPTVTVVAVNGGQVEEGGAASFTVNLSKPSTADTVVVVNAFTGPGNTATAGSDYAGGPVTVTIPAGQVSANFTVATINDTIFEGNETFSVAVTSATSGGTTFNISGTPATETITDNGDKPTVSLSAGSAPEGSPVTFTVTLSNVAAVATTVVVNIASLAGDSATAGSDYVGGPVTVTIPAGQLSASFNVVTINDNVYEGNETFSGVITSATAGGTTLNYSTAPAQATITDGGGGGGGDNGDIPTVTVVAVNGGQVEEGSPASFTVSLSNPSKFDTVVVLNAYSGPGDTATAGSDYVGGPVTVTIPAGQLSANVTVATINDTIFEGNETFSVAVTGATSGGTTVNYSGTPVTETITDNGDKSAVTLSAGSAPEGSPVTFTVTLGTPVAVATTVVVNIASLAGDTATAGVDYTGGPVTVTIPAGQMSATFAVATINDNIFEGNETFSGVITSATAGGTALNFNATPAQATITDDGSGGGGGDNGDIPTVTVVASNGGMVEEGNSASFTVNLSNPSKFDTVVVLNAYTAPGNTATAGSDYVGGPITVTIPAGQVSANFTVATINDTIFEGNETFSVAVTNATSGGTVLNYSAAPLQVTISDSGDAPRVTLSAGSAEEGAPVTFTATLSAAATTDTTVVVNVASRVGDTATAGQDYVGGNYTVTIPAGQLSASFSVATINDNIYEGNETFSGAITSVTGGAIADTTPVTALITDKGDCHGVTIYNGWASEGDEMIFTIRLSSASNTPISLDLETISGTASSSDFSTGGFKYTTIYNGDEAPCKGMYSGSSDSTSWVSASGSNGTIVTFAEGQTEMQVKIRTTEDSSVEPDETFTLRVKQVVSGSLDCTSDTGTGTILTDDYLNSSGNTVTGKDPSVLFGSDQGDKMTGSTLDDVLIGGRGNDILTGGLGDDLFVIRGTYEGTDTIKDYNLNSSGENDRINIADVLEGSGATQSNIDAYVHVDGATGLLSIDPSGSGSSGTNVALLSGITSGADVRLVIDQLGTEVVVHAS